MTDVFFTSQSQVNARRRVQRSEPERPVTPRDGDRRLFNNREVIPERPQSAFGFTTDDYINSLRPPTARSSVERIAVPPTRHGRPFSGSDRPPSGSTSSRIKSAKTVGEVIELFQEGPDSTESRKLLKQLNRVLKKRERLSVQERADIQEVLGQFFDFDTPKLLITSIKIILQYQLSSSATANAIRALFKLSRKKVNDQHINSSTIYTLTFAVIRKIMLNTEKEYDDILIYAIAFLKNAASNKSHTGLVERDGINLTTELIQIALDRNDAKVDQVLIQLTGLLRQLAGFPDISLADHIQFIVAELLTIKGYVEEITFNISRIVSKTSLLQEARESLLDIRCLSVLVDIMQRYRVKLDILVRIAFALGNLCTYSDDARCRMAFDCAAVPRIMDTMQMIGNSLVSDPGDDIIDAFAKMVRLVANLAINSDVGVIVSGQQTIACLLPVLETLVQRSGNTVDEAMLNSVAAITNLSFYFNQNSVLIDLYPQLTMTMLKVVSSPTIEIQYEICRALGNLSRTSEVRGILTENDVFLELLELLQSSTIEIVEAVCGVLLNIAADEDLFFDYHKMLSGIVGLLHQEWMKTEINVLAIVLKDVFNLVLNFKRQLRNDSLDSLRYAMDGLVSVIQRDDTPDLLQSIFVRIDSLLGE
ncbi:hypothetical protein PCE1_002077 [Barthelona sp. PCE]